MGTKDIALLRVHTTFWGFLKEIRFVLSTGAPENGMHPTSPDLSRYAGDSSTVAAVVRRVALGWQKSGCVLSGCDIIAVTMQESSDSCAERTVQAPLIGKLAANLDHLGLGTGSMPARNSREIDPDVLIDVVVGVSGGKDSLCLLCALNAVAAPRGLRLHVAHLDHGLRPESADDAAYVAQIATELGLPYHTDRIAFDLRDKHAGGLENAARRHRFEFLFRTAINVTPTDQIPIVALAHHAEDQVETMLLHLTRGSGLQGLAGMQMDTVMQHKNFCAGDGQPDKQPVRVIRPLLNVDPSDVAGYLVSQGLMWREDSSNADVTFARNRIRHHVTPVLRTINPRLSSALARTASLLAAEWDRILALDKDAIDTVLIEPGTVAKLDSTPALSRVLLDLSTFNGHDRATQRGILRLACRSVQHASEGGHEPTVGLSHIEALIEAATESNATGPHPIVGPLHWSIVGEHSAGKAPVLSIHLRDVLPIAPAHPLLEPSDMPRPIPDNGAVDITAHQFGADGWILHCRLLPVNAIPGDWRSLSAWEGWFDAAKLRKPALVAPSAGLRFRPLGLQGHHRSVSDVFTDAKIHTTLRSRWPLVVDQESGCIHWLCGLRTSEESKVVSTTLRVRRLWWEHASMQRFDTHQGTRRCAPMSSP